MKVLLVVPPKDRYFGVAQYPPVGLGYLATGVRKFGHDVKILDCVRDKMDVKDFEEFVKKNDFDIIGFNVWSLALEEVKNSLKTVKRLKPQAVTIIGGPHPSALPKESMIFFPEADFGFVGEGEIGFPKFVNVVQNGGAFNDIPGLVWRSGGVVNINPPAWLSELDMAGFPSWDLLEPRKYFMPGSLIGKDTAVLTCTRGCPYACTFCSASITAGKKIRRRSIKNILEEMDYLSSNYDIKIFDIPDENFTFHKEFVSEFCNIVLNMGKKYEFFLPNGVRLDTLDREVLSLMRKAGFRREVAVGIESGSERILKLMRKKLSLDTVKEKVRLLHETGFRPIGYFILGFPGETKEDIKKTIRLAIDLKLYAAAFTPFAPMPGTTATNELLKNGELPQDFDFTEIKTDKVAYAPKGMTKKELDRIRKMAIIRFNLRPRPLMYYFGNYNSFKFAISKICNLFIKGGQV